jgi:cytochrome c553
MRRSDSFRAPHFPRNPIVDRPSVRTGLRRIGTVGAAALIAASSPAGAADPSAGRDKAKVCQVCHGIDGVGRMPTVPNIGGESEIYLMKQLKAFRSGERRDPQMSIIAESLTDTDIVDLASWYASIKFTVTVPE